MSAAPNPLSHRYQQALLPLARLSRDPALSKRLSELLALLDFNADLNRSLDLPEILELVLFIAMGETASAWAALALREGDGSLRVVARRGSPEGMTGETLSFQEVEKLQGPVGRADPNLSSAERELLAALSAEFLVPLRKGGKLIGLLALGPRPGDYGEGERAFAEALSVSAASSIDNGRNYEELRRLNQKLSLKVYQLDSLFDITRELHRARDTTRIRQVLLASAMGQLLSTRCALIRPGAVLETRGFKPRPDQQELVRREAIELESPGAPLPVKELPGAALREVLESWGLEVAVPLRSGPTHYGTLLVGSKANGQPLSEEDLEFLSTLCAQGAAALDNLRLTAEWVEKQKIEKELALAREIQRGLLPDRAPSIAGWDIAGVNIPCLTVGGDYYDYIEASNGRLGLAIADVSGKGTGPALLMASTQALLRALCGAGDLPLENVICRLNQLLYREPESGKYVTLFYAQADVASGELAYVNAGHCYPLLLHRGGEVERLICGGPVLGLLPEVSMELGRAIVAPGDLLVMYTDGLSEARSPSGEEFGEARILELARRSRGKPAGEVLAELVGAARLFAAEAGLADDLTLVVVSRSSHARP